MRDFDPTASEFVTTGAIHIGSRHFDFGSILGAGASLLGSSSAADAQEDAAAAQIAQSERQFKTTRADNAPWRNVGVSGLNELARLMGVQTPDYMTWSGQRLPNGLTVEQEAIRRSDAESVPLGNVSLEWYRENDPEYFRQRMRDFAPGIQQEYGLSSDASGSEGFGSLLKKFGVEDFQADPGYAFRQSEGQKGVERSAAARGGLFSGAAGKALSRFNQDLASQEYGNAYSRYTNDQSNIFNRLAGLSGIGQQAQGQINQAASNNTANVSNALAGMGNASAAGSIGMSNAINSGISNYQNYNMLHGLLSGNKSSSIPTNVFFGNGKMAD